MSGLIRTGSPRKLLNAAARSLVIFLFAYHGYCFKLVNVFQQDNNTRSGRFYRIFNEIPVIILVVVIILAYVKPL